VVEDARDTFASLRTTARAGDNWLSGNRRQPMPEHQTVYEQKVPFMNEQAMTQNLGLPAAKDRANEVIAEAKSERPFRPESWRVWSSHPCTA